MGKNFSCNGKRRPSDFYETPYSITRQFLNLGLIDKNSVLEPCAGGGAIVNVLHTEGYSPTWYDINGTGIGQKDFLTETNQYSQIVTNPPFSLAGEFILKAKKVTTSRFAFLLPLNYLHGKQRFDNIWSDTEYPLKSVHVFTRYPRLGDQLRPDGKYKTAMMVYAWYLWEKEHKGDPILSWIDNNEYVIGKKD